MPEDKHKNFNWLSPEKLITSATKLEKNPITNENSYPLSRNSRYLKKLLTRIGYKKD